MTLSELTLEQADFVKNEKLVGELAKALQTQGVILALQVIKNVACVTVATNPTMGLGMLKAVEHLKNLAVQTPKAPDFDPAKQVMLEGFGVVDRDIFPPELQNEPAPPPQ